MVPWLIVGAVALFFLLLLLFVHLHYRKRLHAFRVQHTESLVLQEDEHRAHTRRLTNEHQRELSRASFGLARALLPGLDSLQKAIESARQDPEQQELVEGLALVEQELVQALANHDIKSVAPTAGDAFDPHHHEAIGQLSTNEVPEGSIAHVMRIGWHHPAGLLRPAMVQVATPCEEEGQENTPTPEKKV
jgi:molecular chaperone GrpE (heat shock protein)